MVDKSWQESVSSMSRIENLVGSQKAFSFSRDWVIVSFCRCEQSPRSRRSCFLSIGLGSASGGLLPRNDVPTQSSPGGGEYRLPNRVLITAAVFLFFLCCFGGVAGPAGAAVGVFDVRHWTAPDHTRIVLDLSGPIYYDMFELREPHRLVIDLKDARSHLPQKEIVIDDNVVNRVRWGYFSPSTLRVVLDLVQPSRSKIFTLKKYQEKPDRLVVDVFRSDLENREQEKRTTLRQKARGTFVVVIDPGHGGEDPGAVGPSGTKEKTVVLSIAKKLQEALNNQPGFKAFLTREKDYFIPLRTRWRIAKDYDADLFISIHANGSFDRRKRGAEIYCLSRTGAGQEAARILASKENSSDRIGGVDLASCSDEVDSIIVIMEQTHTINNSLLFGRTALKELKKITRVNFDEPLQAGFAVLKAPDIPSVLVEVDYISNPAEEKKLVDRSFQAKIAESLKNSTIIYFNDVHREMVMVGQ